MCNLPYDVESCANAEYMSPGGHMTKLPVLQCGAFVVSELEPIINLVERKGLSLTASMDADEKNDLRAYLSLTEKIFTNAEVRLKKQLNNFQHHLFFAKNKIIFKWFSVVHLLDGQANIGRSDIQTIWIGVPMAIESHSELA